MSKVFVINEIDGFEQSDKWQLFSFKLRMDKSLFIGDHSTHGGLT